MPELSDWTVDTLHEHMRQRVGDLWAHLDSRAVAQQTAMHEAISTINRIVDVRFDASKEAVDKAQDATEKRFEAVNEFRAQLADQASTFIPRREVETLVDRLTDQITELFSLARAVQADTISRTEYDARHSSLADKIDSQGSRLTKYEGNSAGSKQAWLYLTGGLAAILTIIIIVLTVKGVVT